MKPLTEAQAKEIRGLLTRPRMRSNQGQFIIEGPHLLEAALDKAPELIARIAITSHAAERFAGLLDRCIHHGAALYSISDKLASRLSDTEESQGILGVLRIPEPKIEASGDFALALDGVQDPGNVGTIIRTAAWFGVKSVFLGEGTADPYAPKVIRATQGAIFSVGLESGIDLSRRIAKLRFAGWKVFATMVSKHAKSIFDTEFPSKTLLVFGSEARGIRQGLLPLTDGEIVIPRYGEGESLNVAISAAIILAEATRQRTASLG
ncbi:MAG: RNA methyltransferase [Bacteroidota bacterium]|nr:RNA methyltransferase [Bacteroidota bacterium]MDP4234588.1 RNA methyltransferase [Bacteroidota bacterium]MDP4243717.1 RNA methyltransferase [Bacteroidota bacterium]MDP4288335.1 RNA methyltransferase [Bacteroidota bacterium]